MRNGHRIALRIAIATALVGIAIALASPVSAQCRIVNGQWVCPDRPGQVVQRVFPNTFWAQPQVFQSSRIVQYRVVPNVVYGSVPTIAPVNPSPVIAQQTTDEISVLAFADDRSFVKTVRLATNAAVQSGKITRLQQARIMAAVRLPRIGGETERLSAAELQMEPSATY